MQCLLRASCRVCSTEIRARIRPRCSIVRHPISRVPTGLPRGCGWTPRPQARTVPLASISWYSAVPQTYEEEAVVLDDDDDNDDDDDDDDDEDEQESDVNNDSSSSSQQNSPSTNNTNKKKKKLPSPFKDLLQWRIPYDAKQELESGTFLKPLRRFRHKTLQGYEHYWRRLLWADEWYETKALERYDIQEAELGPPLTGQRNKGKIREWTIQVPGLEEGRPSVLNEDIVHVTWKGRKYTGTVTDVQMDTLQISLVHKDFKSFDPAVDRVHVRFIPSSRMNHRLGHHGTSSALESMSRAVLAPTQKNAKQVLQSLKKYQKQQQTSTTVPEIDWENGNLNQEQKHAVRHVIDGACRPLPYLILGPPGTGKSATVTEAVVQWVKHNPDGRILVLAPSNDAADVLLTKLSQTFLKPSDLTRVISHRRIELVPDHLKRFVHESTKDYEEIRDVIKASLVTVATVNMASRFSFYGINAGFFGTVIIDEAGHAREPDVIAAASTLLDYDGGGQLVLAGDPQQLGPVVLHQECKRLGLDVSFMERLCRYSIYKKHKTTGDYRDGLITMLRKNYRSHESIIRLPNDMFYDGDLQCLADPSTSHNMCQWKQLPKTDFPILFHAITGENLREETSPSWFNPQEVEQSVAYAYALVKQEGLTCDEIGIITPYIAQVSKIRKRLADKGLYDIKVGSVETFQGQERRAIIMSTVRSEREHVSSDLRYNLGFVANAKRFNVALTRAKALLIVVGCPTVLSMDKKNWLPFLEYCREHGAWKGEAWETIDEKDKLLNEEEKMEVEDSASELSSSGLSAEQEGEPLP